MNELSPLKILQDARKLISDPKNWHQGSYADKKNPDGSRDRDFEDLYNPSHPDANCWCSMGALLKVSSSKFSEGPGINEAEEILEFVVREISGGEIQAVALYNDCSIVDHKDIMGMFDRAIEIAEAAQA